MDKFIFRKKNASKNGGDVKINKNNITFRDRWMEG